MRPTPVLSAAAVPIALILSASLVRSQEATAAPRAATSPELRNAARQFSARTGFVEDAGILELRRRAVLGHTAEASPALRFGATRFTSEGPWADVSFRRDDGRVLRLWLVDDAGPPPLIDEARDPWDVRLRWSLSGTKKK